MSRDRAEWHEVQALVARAAQVRIDCALRDLPRVRRPIRALHRLIADPDLQEKVRCTDGVDRSALELQRLYLERAQVSL